MSEATEPTLVFRNVETREFGLTDVAVSQGRITSVGPIGPRVEEIVIDGAGGALLPGLADHHLHLAAMAAHELSTGLENCSLAALADAQVGSDGWVRAVGYFEGQHGNLDRSSLDAVRADVPVRVQHRSGALWVLNSVALGLIGAGPSHYGGIEREDDGVPTGRLWRADHWLREQIGTDAPPSLAATSSRLASYGITHLTDASPDLAPAIAVIEGVSNGSVVQHVQVCADRLTPMTHPRLRLGPLKIIATDHSLPDFDDLVTRIEHAHAIGRSVAVHCVTRASLALVLAALSETGAIPGDRIEHASVAGRAEAAQMASLGVRVVTQPSLITRRGDDYAAEAEVCDLPDLWPYASLLDAGVPVAPSSDAPYGVADPWTTIRAARDRATPSGKVLGPAESVDALRVLEGFLSSLDDPGGRPRLLEIGGPADLVLLHTGLDQALTAPSAMNVRATLVAGELVAGEL